MTVLTTFCYNVEPALVMKPENMFALAIASRSGQFHGVVALLSVMMYHLKRRSVYLSTLIGHIPAMAELMNRCGHAKKQACPKCKLAGDTVQDFFDKPKNTSQTYALKRSRIGELKSEAELRQATKVYRPLHKRTELTEVKLVDPRSKRSSRKNQQPQLGSANVSYITKSVTTIYKEAGRPEQQRNLSGHGPTALLILPYVMLTHIGGVIDGMHKLYLNISKYVFLK